MQVGDLVKVPSGIDYEEEMIGVVVAIKIWQGLREVKVRLVDGSIKTYTPLLVQKIMVI